MSPASHMRNLDLLSPPTVDSCINFFFEHLYPTMPIFSRQHLNVLAVEYRNSSSEVYCLVLSLCAFIMIQPGMSFEHQPMPESYEEDPVSARYRHANMLLNEIHRVRKTIDYVESPTVHSVQISFFLFCSYFGLDNSNKCWYHLREASTLAHLLNMNQEATYKNGDPIEHMYTRRFYWLLLLTERANAIQRHKPLSMLATIELPEVDESSPEAAVIYGFVYLASLFRLIDDEFMSLWNKARSECSESYLAQLQAQLVDTIPPVLLCTENQATDVKITQHWLRCMVWQQCLSNGKLSSESPEISMTYTYPFEIAKDLVRDIRDLSQESMEVHGVGLIEKFFDVSCTLSDIATYTPAGPGGIGSQTPQDYLNHLLALISRLRGGASRYVPLLMDKVKENNPNLVSALSRMPASLDHFASSSDEKMHGVPILTPTAISRQHAELNRVSPNAPPPLRNPFAQPPPPRSTPSNEQQQSRPVLPPPPTQSKMFEAYSPPTYSDAARTPPVPGFSASPSQQYFNQPMPPREVPLEQHHGSLKQEHWPVQHG
ncbi:hypothetical protein LTR66_015808 [Elasticomyces elasticus]|nr:hypothetical protein LTR66_015808 [Elasticomyces elasticus]